MPKLDGLEVLKRLHLLGLPIKVLVLTSKDSAFFADRCIRAGAIGFVEKTEDVDAFSEAIDAVMSGHTYLNDIDVDLTAEDNSEHTDQALINTLSDRELRTMHYLVSGWSNKNIAQAMLLSEKTISTYKIRLLTKLNIKSVVYLAEFARRNNLIE